MMSVHTVANTIVSQFTKLNQLVEQSTIQQPQDVVLEHTKTLVMLELLWVHYHDVSREGDGRMVSTTDTLAATSSQDLPA